MAWRQFFMHLGALPLEAVEAVFMHHGASSVTLMDGGDDPVLEPGPGETPLWTETTIAGLFSEDCDLHRLTHDLLAKFDLAELPPHRIDVLEDRAWEREWLKDFGPMQFGKRLWILPKATQGVESNSVDAVAVYMDPGLAFGTGTHATTALCLEWLDKTAVEEKTLLDYGCGSGVLAIAALKLGCRAAVAMDIDPQALVATQQNAAENGVEDKLQIVGDSDHINGVFDIVIANILARPLVQFAESITSTLAQGGMLVLSGVLCEQADKVMETYAPWVDFDEPAFKEQDGQTWSRLTGKRRVGKDNVYPMP